MTKDESSLPETQEPDAVESKAMSSVKEVSAADPAVSQIIKRSQVLPSPDTIVEGPVVAVEKTAAYIDLAPFGTGIIYGREYINARDVIKKVNIGDVIAAKVVESMNEEGYIELSLREARQAIIWGEAEELVKTKAVIELVVKDANKGGLMLEWQGIPGFLPASQLKTEHYPRVEDGDKDKILDELRKLVGEPLSVSIITAEPKEGKLIFSEKDPTQKEKFELIERYAVGDIVEGEVTGVVDFGIFIKIEDGLEGLVHISEIDWGLVEDPRAIHKISDTVRAKVIEVKDGKISLSIKSLKENPWVSAASKYKKGDIVKGVVIKFNQYGALVSIEEGVAGLVHVSEFGDDSQLREALELAKTYTFQITHFEPKDQKMTLTYMKDEA